MRRGHSVAGQMEATLSRHHHHIRPVGFSAATMTLYLLDRVPPIIAFRQ
jgi:hypothetical protein